ncbi:MAG: T9SS type A sorting domain-containing protein, partial [Bacteroidota bacterium]|nr:T9SS type A sorting domain-containing protein [Bacteroidota bacterium]
AIINIVVSSSGAAPTPVSAQFVKSSTSTLCAPFYDLKTPVIAGATSYSASDSYGGNTPGTIVQNVNGTQSVLFALNLEGPLFGASATVSATGPCGTGFYTTPLTDLAGPPQKCGLKHSASIDLYPNPASGKVTIVTSGQEGKVVFYDALGVARKSVKLQAGISESEISIQDLLAGVYYVRVIIPGLAPFNKQLIVQP